MSVVQSGAEARRMKDVFRLSKCGRYARSCRKSLEHRSFVCYDCEYIMYEKPKADAHIRKFPRHDVREIVG